VKTKKHVLTFEQEYNFQMIGICSHHNDYRLAWGINDTLKISLTKNHEDFIIVNKKGQRISEHTFYDYQDIDNRIEYYLIKNKRLNQLLIPEKPAIDYFLFLIENHLFELETIVTLLKKIPSVLGAYIFVPEEIGSTELLVFN
jgi:hypothetical protein